MHVFYRVLILCVVIIGFTLFPYIVKAEPVNVGVVVVTEKSSVTQKPCKRCTYHIPHVGNMTAIASRYIGSRNPTGFGGNWCGAFMAMVARKAGYKVPNNSNLAISWLKAGYRISSQRIGAYIISRNHVEVYIGNNKSISGNWSGRVSKHSSSRGVYIMPFDK